MKAGSQAQVKAPSQPSFTPMQVGLLQRKCACGGSLGLVGQCDQCQTKKLIGLQTKLAVSEPGDIYEREADRIADQVMATPAHRAVSGAPPHIQRFSGHSNGQMDVAPASMDHALASPGRPLDPALRQDMEQRFGYDFSRVRVHSGAAAEQSAREVNAHAYTVGDNIVFGAGQGFAPGTHEGRRLLAHELTHVVQQQVPRVAAPLYVQRASGGGGAPTPPKPPWLSGVTATHVQGNIYAIDLPGEGRVHVGPYRELANYVQRHNLRLESHHIVGVEFIWMVNTGYTDATMPAVTLRPKGHLPISTHVTAELAYYGGRQGGRVQLTAREIAEIYHWAYTAATPFTTLYRIAINIIGIPKAPVKPPSGSPQAPPPTKAGSKTTLGTRITGGVALAILGASYTFNWCIDSHNAERIKEEIKTKEPAMLKEQKEEPTLGFLFLFRYSGGATSGQGASASAHFERLSWRRGYTEQEARASWQAEAKSDRPGITYQTAWRAPLVAPSPDVLRTPFDKVWLAKFADISQIEFQRVQFKEWGGFDTDGKDGPVDATKWNDDAEEYRFLERFSSYRKA